MSGTNPSVCVDVTTLIHWQRPAVGIVRVEQQLCRWLLSELPPNLHFVAFDSSKGQFKQLTHSAVQSHLDRLDSYSTAQHVTAQQALPNLEERLRRKALSLLSFVPAPWRLSAYRQLLKARPIIHTWVKLARRVRSKLKSNAAVQTPAEDNTFFELPRGSTYISLGLDWNYKDMAQIYRIKKAQDLKLLLFCYDIIPIRLPHLCVADVSRQFAHYFVDLAWCADLILCISESSQRDLTGFLGNMSVPQPRTEVIRLGADILPGQGETGPVSEGISRFTNEPYILFVSTIERRKNHEILYRAYTRLAEEGLALPQLIFVGMPGWGVGELHADLALDPRTQGRIHALNHVNDIELAHLYQNASFTVYPSLYEGWGLPVAESLAYGKFCLCANTSSLPEVGEQWVEYLDPWDLPAWVERLRFFITHPEEIAQRNAAISAGYSPHPWRQTAADIYRHACALSQS
ncbi:D-inositol-3-phosphate glycosyltransferase [Polaromonas vacuolata]|uniref:D-inositol-3-phosphate glycosyltransferase n=1 Tax=Polaromonas vacuolata TaxID=37448 RepID=A0A6H2H5Y3_9BURK|nr:glycosyltransferase family 1 protein [Polaromonas vacuolata]QJC55213.1 D-inositol-3-phosphate glycosyltransferase [Polaromonas vacuolata]